jgi:hypothetical protein
LQLRPCALGGGFALRDHLACLVEVARTQAAELGCDQHVLVAQQCQTALHVLLGQDVDHLRRQAAHRRQGVARCQRRAHVDGDQHVDAEGPRHVDREVVGQAAITEDAALHFGGRKDAGHAHAGAQRQRQVTLRQDGGLARFHVGGQGTKRDRQRIEVGDGAHRQRVAAQQRLQAAARKGTQRRTHFAVAHAEFDQRRDLEVFFLAPLRQLLAGDARREHRTPIEVEQHGFELARRHAAGVQAADDGAHRGADDHVDGHPLCFQQLEHAHMGQATRAAAAEHEADARAR